MSSLRMIEMTPSFEKAKAAGLNISQDINNKGKQIDEAEEEQQVRAYEWDNIALQYKAKQSSWAY